MSHPTHATIDPVETLSETEHGEHHKHVTPFWTMFWVFIVLLAFTALTVWSSNIHSIQFGNTTIEIGGTFHIMLALTIAVVKSVLVAAYFMHLRYDTPMNTVVVSATIFAVILFIGFTLSDSASRHIFAPTEMQVIIPGGSAQVVQRAIEAGQQQAANPEAGHSAEAPAAGEPAPAAPPASGAGGH